MHFLLGDDQLACSEILRAQSGLLIIFSESCRSGLIIASLRRHLSGRHACHGCAIWNISCHDCASANACTASYGDATKNERSRADRSFLLYQSCVQVPFTSFCAACRGCLVVDKDHPMSYKDVIFDSHPRTDEGVTLDAAVVAYDRVALYLDKGPNHAVVTD